MSDLDAVRQRAATDIIYKLHALDWECLLDLATQAFEDRGTLLAKVERLRRLVDENSDRLQEPHPEVERLRATVAQVEALADNWEAIPYDNRTPYDEGWHDALDHAGQQLRDALRGEQ